jgi:diguanylate cyclase (GGDEF)-like protein
MPWVVALTIASLLAVIVSIGFGVRETKRRKELEAKLALLLSQNAKDQLTDRLTGLLSLEGFESALTGRADKADSAGGSFCVIYLALDELGMINDGFGREKAEKLLVATAEILKTITGEQAAVCRINGGEFAFYVSGGINIGQDVAQKLCRRMEQSIQIGAAIITATCSIGISAYPEHGAHQNLLSFAALAMRTVKLAGGSDFCVYDVHMGTNMRDQVSLLLDLRKALELGQFELYFQPKVDSETLQFTAAEALLRWHHPEKGFVSPGVFIPIAEKYGLMGPIGRWVIAEACTKAANWKSRGLRMRVAVNISGYQMREDDLMEYIESTIEQHGIAPNRFTCEITESVAMEDTKVTQQTFEKMGRAGFHVSIDDFGTGYSSLATLRKLPAAELKIDRAFVTDLEANEDARSIAHSIVSLGKTLKLRVVAEGIETVGQCEILVQMGCDELQGYLFAMPMPAEQLEEMAFDASSNKSKDFRASLYSSTLMQGLN